MVTYQAGWVSSDVPMVTRLIEFMLNQGRCTVDSASLLATARELETVRLTLSAVRATNVSTDNVLERLSSVACGRVGNQHLRWLYNGIIEARDRLNHGVEVAWDTPSGYRREIVGMLAMEFANLAFVFSVAEVAKASSGLEWVRSLGAFIHSFNEDGALNTLLMGENGAYHTAQELAEEQVLAQPAEDLQRLFSAWGDEGLPNTTECFMARRVAYNASTGDARSLFPLAGPGSRRVWRTRLGLVGGLRVSDTPRFYAAPAYNILTNSERYNRLCNEESGP